MMTKPTLGPNAGKVWDFAANDWERVSEDNRTHRLKAIGNGIVPADAQVFAIAIYRLLKKLNHAKNQNSSAGGSNPPP